MCNWNINKKDRSWTLQYLSFKNSKPRHGKYHSITQIYSHFDIKAVITKLCMIDLLRCQHWITVCTKEQLIMIARLVSLFTVLSTLTTSNRIWWKEVQFKPNSWHTAKAWLAQSACNFSLVTRFICLLSLAKRCSLPTCNGTNLEKISL